MTELDQAMERLDKSMQGAIEAIRRLQANNERRKAKREARMRSRNNNAPE